jgi:putative nucleotidyltransferase with HDIG domain
LKRHHIAAGNYYLGKSQAMTLEAYLGTCVAVALHDAKTGIGGLIHLLLPEPISPDSPLGAEKYATTGLPIFLRALHEAGALPKNIRASIAGGALVGTVDDIDLELDIGGRTVDRVMQFIEKEKIPVEQSETGGFFTCRLSVDMRSWDCRIAPNGIDKLDAVPEVDAPTPEKIRQTAASIKPIPQMALKILRMIDEDLYEIDEFIEEIRKDQVISARTLELCNSAMFSTRKQIESLDHAVIMLGQKWLLKLVVSDAINHFFNQCGMGYSLCKGGIYHHAIGTAILAEKLADYSGVATPSAAYTAGLLHDIGKVALDQHVSDAFPLFYRQLNDEKRNLLEIEQEVFRTDHTRIGGDLADQWNLPESLADAIRYHHTPETADRNTVLVHLVYLADLVMSRFNARFELERMNTFQLESCLKTLGLSMDQFPSVVDLVTVHFRGVHQAA